jgi:hypothetical protein
VIEQVSPMPVQRSAPEPADFCEYLPDASRQPCHAPGELAEPPCGLPYFGRPTGKCPFTRASR